MKLSTKEDIAAPIEHVFAMATEFEAFERAGLRRGAEIMRADRLKTHSPGMTWKIAFDWRQKRRRVVAELTEIIPPNSIQFDIEGGAVSGALNVELIAMSPRRTRVTVELEFRPKTLGARLVIQTLRMTRGKQREAFRKRVADFSRHIETRYNP